MSIGGIVVGVLAAIALTRVMASLLVGVSSDGSGHVRRDGRDVHADRRLRRLDPARRAAALNPNVALRDEDLRIGAGTTESCRCRNQKLTLNASCITRG